MTTIPVSEYPSSYLQMDETLTNKSQSFASCTLAIYLLCGISLGFMGSVLKNLFGHAAHWHAPV